MVKRGELTDEAWAWIAPLLPEKGRLGIGHTIPERQDQRERRTSRTGRPPGFDRELYSKRNVVERCVGRFKQWRGVAMRYRRKG